MPSPALSTGGIALHETDGVFVLTEIKGFFGNICIDQVNTVLSIMTKQEIMLRDLGGQRVEFLTN